MTIFRFFKMAAANSGGRQLGQHGTGVPTATIVWFSDLLQAGGNRLANAI